MSSGAVPTAPGALSGHSGIVCGSWRIGAGACAPACRTKAAAMIDASTRRWLRSDASVIDEFYRRTPAPNDAGVQRRLGCHRARYTPAVDQRVAASRTLAGVAAQRALTPADRRRTVGRFRRARVPPGGFAADAFSDSRLPPTSAHDERIDVCGT